MKQIWLTTHMQPWIVFANEQIWLGESAEIVHVDLRDQQIWIDYRLPPGWELHERLLEAGRLEVAYRKVGRIDRYDATEVWLIFERISRVSLDIFNLNMLEPEIDGETVKLSACYGGRLELLELQKP